MGEGGRTSKCMRILLVVSHGLVEMTNELVTVFGIPCLQKVYNIFRLFHQLDFIPPTIFIRTNHDRFYCGVSLERYLGAIVHN